MATVYERHHALHDSCGWTQIPPPYPYDAKEKLTKESLSTRIDSVFRHVDLYRGDYWGITDELDRKTLDTSKWRTYLYLKKCVNEYRSGQRDELLAVLDFLKVSKNKTWLAARLLDKNRKEPDEEWGTSKHEWIERSLIVEVIKRSAGMVVGVEAETDYGCIADEIDWLYLQAVVRSPNKYAFFKRRDYSLKTGHVGAIKPDLVKRGFATSGSYSFHADLKAAFRDSKTIEGCLRRIRTVFKRSLYSGKKTLQASPTKGFVVTGTDTRDEAAVNDFRVSKLYSKGYVPFSERLWCLIEFSTNNWDREDLEEVSEEESDSSDDGLPQIELLTLGDQ